MKTNKTKNIKVVKKNYEEPTLEIFMLENENLLDCSANGGNLEKNVSGEWKV